MRAPALRLAVLALVTLLGSCAAAGRHEVTVRNASDAPVVVGLEERHPDYPTVASAGVELAPGQSARLWWHDDFTTDAVFRQGDREVGRTRLAPGQAEVAFPASSPAPSR